MSELLLAPAYRDEYSFSLTSLVMQMVSNWPLTASFPGVPDVWESAM